MLSEVCRASEVVELAAPGSDSLNVSIGSRGPQPAPTAIQHISQQMKATLVALNATVNEAFEGDIAAWEKPDGSPVTSLDLRVEAILRERLAAVLPEAFFLGEESSGADLGLAGAAMRSPYIWACDPIDGTSNLVRRNILFAVSVGLLENSSSGMRPVVGGLLVPRMHKLFYTDETGVIICDLRSGDETRLQPGAMRAPEPTVFADAGVVAEDLRTDAHLILRPSLGSAAIELLSASMGWATAAATRDKLWDIAGAWAIADKLGLQLYDIETLRPRAAIAADDLDFRVQGRPWQLKTQHVLTRPNHIAEVSALFDRSAPVARAMQAE